MAKKQADTGTLPRFVRATRLGWYQMRRRRPGEVFRLNSKTKRLAKWMEPATERDFYDFQRGGTPAPVAPVRAPQIDHQGRVLTQNPPPPADSEAGDDGSGDQPTGDQSVI